MQLPEQPQSLGAHTAVRREHRQHGVVAPDVRADALPHHPPPERAHRLHVAAVVPARRDRRVVRAERRPYAASLGAVEQRQRLVAPAPLVTRRDGRGEAALELGLLILRQLLHSLRRTAAAAAAATAALVEPSLQQPHQLQGLAPQPAPLARAANKRGAEHARVERRAVEQPPRQYAHAPLAVRPQPRQQHRLRMREATCRERRRRQRPQLRQEFACEARASRHTDSRADRRGVAVLVRLQRHLLHPEQQLRAVGPAAFSRKRLQHGVVRPQRGPHIAARHLGEALSCQAQVIARGRAAHHAHHLVAAQPLAARCELSDQHARLGERRGLEPAEVRTLAAAACAARVRRRAE